MGKIRKGRRKLHLKAVQPEHKEQSDSLRLNETELLPAIFPSVDLFNPLSANGETSRNFTEKNLQENKKLTKKDKRKERHERFLKKLHASKIAKDKAKKAEKRAKTVIVGDLEPLLSALPTVTTAVKNKNLHPNKTNVAPREKMTKRKQHRIQLAEIEQFKRVLEHPLYKANPIGTIAEHIKNVIQKQQEV